MFVLPGFPGARQFVEDQLPPKRLAALLIGWAVMPYLIYSVPTGLFSAKHCLALLLLAAVAPLLFVLMPPKRPGFGWQDFVAIAVLVSPVISGLTSFFRDAFPGPEGVPRLDILGKLMVISVGSMAYLSLRHVENLDFRLFPSWQDLRTGTKHFAYYLPFGVSLALLSGFVEWAPREALNGALVIELVGTVLGIFFATALGEELCFRGIMQNLLEKTLQRPLAAQGIAAAAFGAVHLSSRFYPNWGFALASMVAGWFYGNAFRDGRSVAAARTTHTLVVVTLTFLFRFVE